MAFTSLIVNNSSNCIFDTISNATATQMHPTGKEWNKRQWLLICNEHVVIVAALNLIKTYNGTHTISVLRFTMHRHTGGCCVRTLSGPASVNIRGKRRCHDDEGAFPTERSLPSCTSQCNEGERAKSERGLLFMQEAKFGIAKRKTSFRTENFPCDC
jgi:hypothetical protein